MAGVRPQLRRVRAVGRLVAPQAGDPGVDLAQRALERLDLAHPAAGVRVALPQAVDPLAAVDVDLDPVALLDPPPGLVRLREQDAGVEREDARLRARSRAACRGSPTPPSGRSRRRTGAGGTRPRRGRAPPARSETRGPAGRHASAAAQVSRLLGCHSPQHVDPRGPAGGRDRRHARRRCAARMATSDQRRRTGPRTRSPRRPAGARRSPRTRCPSTMPSTAPITAVITDSRAAPSAAPGRARHADRAQHAQLARALVDRERHRVDDARAARRSPTGRAARRTRPTSPLTCSFCSSLKSSIVCGLAVGKSASAALLGALDRLRARARLARHQREGDVLGLPVALERRVADHDAADEAGRRVVDPGDPVGDLVAARREEAHAVADRQVVGLGEVVADRRAVGAEARRARRPSPRPS